jgi:hypothetical protein
MEISAASILDAPGGRFCPNCNKPLPMDRLKEAASGYLAIYRALAAISMPPRPEWNVAFPW